MPAPYVRPYLRLSRSMASCAKSTSATSTPLSTIPTPPRGVSLRSYSMSVPSPDSLHDSPPYSQPALPARGSRQLQASRSPSSPKAEKARRRAADSQRSSPLCQRPWLWRPSLHSFRRHGPVLQGRSQSRLFCSRLIYPTPPARQHLGTEQLLSSGSPAAHRPLRPAHVSWYVQQLATLPPPHPKRGERQLGVQLHVVLDVEPRLDGQPASVPLRRAELLVLLARQQRQLLRDLWQPLLPAQPQQLELPSLPSHHQHQLPSLFLVHAAECIVPFARQPPRDWLLRFVHWIHLLRRHDSAPLRLAAGIWLRTAADAHLLSSVIFQGELLDYHWFA